MSNLVDSKIKLSGENRTYVNNSGFSKNGSYFDKKSTLKEPN